MKKTDLQKVKLKKLRKLKGKMYFHRFIKGDDVVEQIITRKDYRQLAKKDAGQPTPPEGYTWEQSYETFTVNTPSKQVEPGTYLKDEVSAYVALPTGEYLSVPKEDVSDGVLSEKLVDKLSKFGKKTRAKMDNLKDINYIK